MANHDQRFKFIDDESYFDRHGPAVAWVGSDGKPATSVEDRFTGQFFRKSPWNGELIEDEPLAEEGTPRGSAISLPRILWASETTKSKNTTRRRSSRNALINCLDGTASPRPMAPQLGFTSHRCRRSSVLPAA
jgi:hypothetical protein